MPSCKDPNDNSMLDMLIGYSCIQIRILLLLLLLSGFRKQEEGKTFHKLHVLGMNDDLWDRVYELGS